MPRLETSLVNIMADSEVWNWADARVPIVATSVNAPTEAAITYARFDSFSCASQ